MQNTKTDIIRKSIAIPSTLSLTRRDAAPYGFMHQPSALWPPPSAEFAEKSRTRLKTGKDGKIMRTPTPTTRSRKTSKQSKGSTENGGPATEQPSHPSVAGEDAQKVEANGDAKHNGDAKPWVNPYIPKPGGKGMSIKDGPESETGLEPAKILQLEVDGKQVEIAEQIQLCATNDQLTHPLCSPALAASLGGLPKLFIVRHPL